MGLSTLATYYRHQYQQDYNLIIESVIADQEKTHSGVRGQNNEQKRSFSVNTYKEYEVIRSPEPPVNNEDVSSMEAVEIYFLNNTQLDHKDGFSASWLQSRSDFLSMPFDRMHICEDAAFRAYDRRRKHKMRVTLDWMDWSVEHMSKWWKTLKWDGDDPIPYNSIMSHFENYLAGASNFPQEDDPTFKETIAVIAFQAYKNGKFPERAHDLSKMSLAATIESLRRAGFGRVTVGILEESDLHITHDAFKTALDFLYPQNNHNPTDSVSRIGRMEVGYAWVASAYIRTQNLARNIPRAVLFGLRDAFKYSKLKKSKRSDEMARNMTSWLGNRQNPSFWKYVYLTEPDTILQTRPSALLALKAEVDNGSVLLPHRLQPIPHESDVRGMKKDKNLFLFEDDFEEVIDLDPLNSHDVCCDEDAGPMFRPGREPNFDRCGQFWYACGFGRRLRNNPNRHDRIKPYKLMRLIGGTGVTSIAGSEHGRRCIPKKKAVCRPS